MIYGDGEENERFYDDHYFRKQELRELKMLQKQEQKQFQDLAFKNNVCRYELVLQPAIWNHGSFKSQNDKRHQLLSYRMGCASLKNEISEIGSKVRDWRVRSIEVAWYVKIYPRAARTRAFVTSVFEFKIGKGMVIKRFSNPYTCIFSFILAWLLTVYQYNKPPN